MYVNGEALVGLHSAGELGTMIKAAATAAAK
jgi:hypothetical protein